jgi:protein-S-isoprenylcysteine O-methyltransferase Ste14
MEARSRRKSRRTRWTPAILLAAVALTMLVVASPAVAKPAHIAHAQGAALSAAGMIAVLVIAACGALALVLLAFLSVRPQRSRSVEISAAKTVSRGADHRAAA